MLLTAPCGFGIESVLTGELKRMGFSNIRTENGRVTFEGGQDAIPRANIGLRTAERVYVEMGDLEVSSFDALFDATQDIHWESFISRQGAFPVTASCLNAVLHSVPDCQKIIKKAVSVRLGAAYGMNWLPETGPIHSIHAFIQGKRCRIYLDTSGTGLHKRGYRVKNVAAPLSETLAAALLMISYWKPGTILLDPFCGSGTVIIEAAMMAKNIAPGSTRSFDAVKWESISQKVWKNAYEEAKEQETNSPAGLLLGSDIDRIALEHCRTHACRARVDDVVSFRSIDFRKLEKPGEYGVLLCNPPYGKRMGEGTDLTGLYQNMGKKIMEFNTWSHYILTGYPDLERDFGRKAHRKRKLYNGMIPCQFYQYFGPLPSRG